MLLSDVLCCMTPHKRMPASANTPEEKKKHVKGNKNKFENGNIVVSDGNYKVIVKGIRAK